MLITGKLHKPFSFPLFNASICSNAADKDVRSLPKWSFPFLGISDSRKYAFLRNPPFSIRRTRKPSSSVLTSRISYRTVHSPTSPKIVLPPL